MIDIETRGAPGWYLKRLFDKLTRRRGEVEPLFQRFENESPMPDHIRNGPEAAQAFFKAARTAFGEMVVKAVKYPLRVQGVNTTAIDEAARELGDDIAYRMMRRSGMSVEIDDVHLRALTAGNAYAIVSMYDGSPHYTAEDPREVVTIHDPVVQSKVVAAAKFFFHDEDGEQYAYLYLPGRVWRAKAPGGPRRQAPKSLRFSRRWEWDDTFGGHGGQELPFSDFMPVFRYRNEEGVGEFERHIGNIDRIEHMILQGMTIATLQAFKQRAIKVDPAVMPDEDPDTGEEIDYNDILTADPGALWKLPDTAEIWESGNVDLTPVWTGMDKFIQQYSAATFTPLAMFSPEGQNQSAEGAAFAREGRTFKIEDRQDRFGDVHARALAALFRLDGDMTGRAEHEDIDFVWRPAERYSLGEKADALVKYRTGEVPWRTRMIEVGQFTPRQVKQMETERLNDELFFPSLVEAMPRGAPEQVES